MGLSEVEGGNKVTGPDDVQWINKVECAAEGAGPWNE